MLKKYLIRTAFMKNFGKKNLFKKRVLTCAALGAVILVSFVVLAGWATFRVGGYLFQEASQIASRTLGAESVAKEGSEKQTVGAVISSLGSCLGKIQGLLSYEALFARSWSENFQLIVGACWMGEARPPACDGAHCPQITPI